MSEAYDETLIELCKLFEKERIKTRERHAREKDSIIAASAGVSRETMRKCRVVSYHVAPAVLDDIRTGKRNDFSRLYNQVIGDERVGLFVKISPDLRERMRAESVRRNMTTGQLIEFMYTQIFGDNEP